MQIVPYKSEHKKFFTEINARWIEKYFEIEPYDFEQFDRSKEIFIDEDGYIFIGIIEEKPMASFALLKLEDGIFELSKMAVSIEYLGQGYGNQLIASLSLKNVQCCKSVTTDLNFVDWRYIVVLLA